MIGLSVPIALRPHRVTLQNPGEPIPDGSGGYTEGWTDLNPPTLDVRISPATAADLERVAAGTITASASHLIVGPFHPDVTTRTRLLFTDIHGASHTYQVTGVSNRELRDAEMTLVCEERVP